MNASLRPAGVYKALWIEWKARRYRDPIDRLRYLRRASNGRSALGLKPHFWRSSRMVLLFFVCLGIGMQTSSDASLEPDLEFEPSSDQIAPTNVWRIENGKDYDAYSNGLRIDNSFLAPNIARSYYLFRYDSAGAASCELRSQPAGILFHTSESAQVPFESSHNNALKRIVSELLEYVKRNQSYHFVVDRFGRVYRVVPETDVANHAGKSVWSDQNGVYLDLNRSFFGISFEAHTQKIDDGSYLSPAQVHSGRLLVEMLVNKYSIPLDNCVTHAQVSVNPDNMKIGYHTDGSGDFPFQDLGLPDNYSQPISSLLVFGFDYDLTYLKATGFRLWKGLLLAEEKLREEAMSRGLSPGQYKNVLQKRYQATFAELENMAALEGRTYDTRQ